MVLSPTRAATSRCTEKALSQAMPISATPMPRCATTMPHVASGTWRNRRPRRGSRLATTTPGASVSPINGISATPPCKPASTAASTLAASGASSPARTRTSRSRRQRNSGPTAITTSIGTANTALIGVK